MALALHLIWIGHAPPLRAMQNLCHVLNLFESELSTRQEQSVQSQSCIPLLWLNQSAWSQIIKQQVMPATICDWQDVPHRWLDCLQDLLQGDCEQCRWLHLNGHHLPVMLVEDGISSLRQAWTCRQQAMDLFAHVFSPPVDQLRHLSDVCTFEGFLTLYQHVCQQWASHGLLCLASDLLRLLVLVWKPGAYVDLGDVAGRLMVLPTANDAGSNGICAHHTVAIENDLIVACDQIKLMTIVLGAHLRSLTSISRIALNLGIHARSGLDLLQRVLPHLDHQLPTPPPDVAQLFRPPWLRLADYINLAYGAPPIFNYGPDLSPYTQVSRGKQLLVNDVAGFTGFQSTSHRLLPANRQNWNLLADRYGLADYAPQLGWKTYGYGTIDRIIDLGLQLSRADCRSQKAIDEDLAVLSNTIHIPLHSMQQLATFCSTIFVHLRDAHVGIAGRQEHVLAVKRLCNDFSLD